MGTGGSKPSGGGKASLGLKQYSDGTRGQATLELAGMKLEKDDDIRETTARVLDMMSEGLKSGQMSVRIRMPVEAAEKALLADGGTLKTQRETGTSSGVFDPSQRDFAEKEMFGVPGLDPIYGYVAGFQSDNNGVDTSQGFLGMYGEVSIVLKPEVVDRTTITFGDSLYETPPPAQLANIRDRTPGVEAEMVASVAVGTFSYVHSFKGNEMSKGLDMASLGYVEAQIIGGVSKKDIQKIIMQEKMGGEPYPAQQLRDAGYEVEVLPYERNKTSFSLEDVYARRMEELACHDASCAPPPVGTGGSKPGGARPSGPARGKLSPTDSGRVKPDAMFVTSREARGFYGGDKALKEAVTKALSTDLGKGFGSEVYDVSMDQDGIEIYGNLTHNGELAGKFKRHLFFDDGELVMYHETLKVRSEFQGQGVAQKFNDHAMKYYEEIGVDRIEVTASLSHGPYAWARQGYRLAEGRHRWVDGRIRKARKIIDDAVADPDRPEITDASVADIRQQLTDLRNASESAADVQPIHVASLGQGDPIWGDRWPGKEALIDRTDSDYDQTRQFEGVYYLGRESTLTAALEARLEELACHDASCAPPPIGTGGSKPSSGGAKGGSVALKFSKAATIAERDDLFRKAGNASVELNEARSAEKAAQKAYFNGGPKTDEGFETYQAARAAVDVAMRKQRDARFALEKSRVVEAEVTTPGGKKFKVYKDSTASWDDALVQASVDRYARLLDEFKTEPLNMVFGSSAATVNLIENVSDIKGAWKSYALKTEQIKANMEKFESSNGYVTGDLNKTARTWQIGITAETASTAPIEWSEGGFNPNVPKLSAAGRAEYTVTHEFGHMLYFDAVRSGKWPSEDSLLLDSGMQAEWRSGMSAHELRLPSLGSYAYSSAREFAAESFAVDYNGWDNDSGVPLEMMLGWAYEQRA